MLSPDAGVVRAIQYDDRRRQRGINSEVECLRHRITRIVSRFHISV